MQLELDLAAVPRLERLQISNFIVPSSSLFRLAAESHSSEHLGFCDCTLPQATVITSGSLRVVQVISCSSMKQLHLNCSRLGELELYSCSDLEHVHVTAPVLPCAHMASLQGLVDLTMACSSLRQLCLANCNSSVRLELDCPHMQCADREGCEDCLEYLRS